MCIYSLLLIQWCHIEINKPATLSFLTNISSHIHALLREISVLHNLDFISSSPCLSSLTRTAQHHIPTQRTQHTFRKTVSLRLRRRPRWINEHGVNAHATLLLNESFLPFVMMMSNYATSLSRFEKRLGKKMYLTCPSFEFRTWTEFGLSHTRTPTCLHSNELLEAKAKSEGGEGGWMSVSTPSRESSA